MIHVFFVVLIFIFIYTLFKHKNYCDLINKIPGPRPQPIIGNFWMLNVSADKLWNVYRRLNTCYYPIARYWLGPIPFIAVRHPDDLKIVLSSSKHVNKGFAYKCLCPWLKTGLLTSSGEKWHQRREDLTSAFHLQTLRTYLYIFEDNSKKFVDALIKDNTNTVLNLISLSEDYALNTICETSMGLVLDELDTGTAQKYKEGISTIREVIAYRIIRPLVQDWMLHFSSKIRKMQSSALKTLLDLTHTVRYRTIYEFLLKTEVGAIQHRKEYHLSSRDEYLIKLGNGTNENESQNSSRGFEAKIAILDVLVKSEKNGIVDTEGIKEELDTLVFTGRDTTAMALVFIIMLLAEHPEIQLKARQEVDNVFGRYQDGLYMRIQELHYLERCIKESLRPYPPFHCITRRLAEDINLREFLIPSGTELGCCVFDVHRDPSFWPKPTKFDPDRFLFENIQNRHLYAYIPFSAGPRDCIGQKFAMMQLKCLMAHILLNFKLEPVTKLSDVKIKMDIITRPSAPVYTQFVRINNGS